MTWRWLTPAEGLPVTDANRVELLSLISQDAAPEHGWPDSFWLHVSGRFEPPPDETRAVLTAFRDLEPGESARCHLPPWGLALYRDDALLLTATLCFSCSNAYVYSANGRELRAFDLDGVNAKLLRGFLTRHLQIQEP